MPGASRTLPAPVPDLTLAVGPSRGEDELHAANTGSEQHRLRCWLNWIDLKRITLKRCCAVADRFPCYDPPPGITAENIGMAIYRLLQNLPMGPEEISRLAAAYEQTLLALRLTDRNDPITEMIAKKIIEIAQTGVKEPARISALAIEQLGIQ